MIEEASYYNHGMQCTKSTHTAVSNTKPTAYKTQPLMGQSRTIVGGENVVHRMQTTCAYNAPNPEQKTVQVRDSLTKLSYRKKPLPWPPKREGNSMNVTCYECGQVGHIWTNCPHRASSAAWIMWSSPLLWCFAVSFSNHSQCLASRHDLAMTSTSVSSSRFLWLYWGDSLWDLSLGSLDGWCICPSCSRPSLTGCESFWWDNPSLSSLVWWVCDRLSCKHWSLHLTYYASLSMLLCVGIGLLWSFACQCDSSPLSL